MAKNIILCSDGTGNTADKGRGTNVFKLFEAVDLNGHRTNPDLDAQLAFYDDGVGTEGIFLKRVLGGATGYGLKSNVKQLYRELTRVYDEGDHIFLFGFSRGAFTVRTLAGMIGACGILNSENFATATDLRRGVDAAYKAYRAKYDSVLTKLVGRSLRRADGSAAIARFQERYAPRTGCRIAFIGVWDTVDAVGLPFALTRFVNRVLYQFKFPTQDLGAYVDRAYHALSIDDPRVAFAPVLWTVTPGTTDPRLEQVWFSGVHSNVGGGYPKQGMSLVALDWMLSHAARGQTPTSDDRPQPRLRLQVLDHELFRGHASVDDMLYDPRSGLGRFYRWAPRDIAGYCRAHGITPRLHITVAERIAHGTDDYAPGNLPPDSTLAFTPEGDPHKDALLARRAREVERVFQAAHRGRSAPVMEEVRGAARVGDFSYWLLSAAWFLLVAGLLGAAASALRSTEPWTLGVLVESRAAAAIATSLLAFAAATVLSEWATRKMNDTFTRFWHSHQQELRRAMKDAHHRARMERKGVEHPAFRYY